MWSVSDSAAKSCVPVSGETALASSDSTNLSLPSVSLILGYTDLIEDAMELADDRSDLRGQVASIHC